MTQRKCWSPPSQIAACFFLFVARLAASPSLLIATMRRAMEEIAPGKQAITKVVLHPRIEWISKLGKGETWIT